MAEPVPVPNRNRDRFLGFLAEPNRTNRHQRSGKTVHSNRTETLVPALRSTRTRRFRPPDQPEPVGRGQSDTTFTRTRHRRGHPTCQTDSSSIPSTFPDRFTVSPVSPQRSSCRLPGAHVKNKRHTLHNNLYNHLYNHLHNVSIYI